MDEIVRVGMSGRLIKGKRYDILLQAVSELRNQNIYVVCSIAGGGPDEQNMSALAGALDVTDRVKFLGLLTRAEMMNFYQSLDFYVHATDGETICYSIMEAQACGLPVVASNVEGVYNVIDDGHTGMLFNTPDELVRCIRRLIEDGPLRNKLSINARNLAVENFKKFKSVEMLYKEIKALEEHRW
jgi:glycosyltransferase involved in cell wall biosynthesis